MRSQRRSLIAVPAAPGSVPGVRRLVDDVRDHTDRSWPSVSRFGTSGRSPTEVHRPGHPDRWAVAAPARGVNGGRCSAQSRDRRPRVFRRTKVLAGWSAVHES